MTPPVTAAPAMQGGREAGPEMDAEVAEMLGWRRAPQKNPPSRFWPIRGTRQWYAPGSPHARALPHFSTDMTAAMAVLSDMARPGFRVHIAANGCGEFDVTWDVAGGHERLRWGCLAEETGVSTLPLALCRALLSMQGPNESPALAALSSLAQETTL